MPNFEIRGNGLDVYWLHAVMNFPQDDANRRAYYALQFARAELAGAVNGSIDVSAALLSDLIDAPSYSAMRALVKTTTKKGFVAGDFLLNLYGMHSFPEKFKEPSVRKAVALSQAFAERSAFGDGSPLPTSITAIRNWVDEFRPVAHLWAAFRLHQTFPIRPDKEIFASVDAIDDFLGIAANLQDFGCAFEAKKGKKKGPVLDPEGIWRISDTHKRLRPPWKEAPPFLIQVIAEYEPTTAD